MLGVNATVPLTAVVFVVVSDLLYGLVVLTFPAASLLLAYTVYCVFDFKFVNVYVAVVAWLAVQFVPSILY